MRRGKIWRSAVNAGKPALQARAAAMPGADIAVGMRLGAATAEVFNQAALLAQRMGGGLEFVKFVARAAVMHQPVGVMVQCGF